MINKEIVEWCTGIINKLCEENRFRNKEIQQGVDGEKEHAITVLSWVKKLEKHPSVALRISALFHDIDRLVTPGAGRGFAGDRKSEEYLLHKKMHAKRSADYTSQKLKEMGIEESIIIKTRFLIEHHDDILEEISSYKDKDLEILVAADAFSWFSTTGINLLKSEGEERTKDKLRFILSKTPKFALELLPEVKINNLVLENLKKHVLKEIIK
ncbi:MAG: DUF4202 family protein [Candidatus Woesebacteria bacterium]|nr:DUF4202 family protein [Candidatus Woesebacteria bacterium]